MAIPPLFEIGNYLVPGVSAQCAQAVGSLYSDLFSKCNGMGILSATTRPYTPGTPEELRAIADEISASLTNTVLPTPCSADCRDLIDSISSTLTPACGDGAIFVGTSYTGSIIGAATLSSYGKLASDVLCGQVPGDNSYCFAKTFPYFVTPAPPDQPDYFPPPPEKDVACTPCATKELSILKESTSFVDYDAIAPFISVVEGNLTEICSEPNIHSNLPNTMGSLSDSDLGVFLAPGLSTQCVQAIDTVYSDLLSQCDFMGIFDALFTPYPPGTPAEQKAAADAISASLSNTILPTACSSNCKNVVNRISSTITPACGTSPIFSFNTLSGTPFTVESLISYGKIVSDVLCGQVPDDNSYCFAKSFPYLVTTAPADQPDYILPPPDKEVACSSCTKRELAIFKASTNFVDFPVIKPAIDIFEGNLTAFCAEQPDINLVSSPVSVSKSSSIASGFIDPSSNSSVMSGFTSRSSVAIAAISVVVAAFALFAF